jgi:mersacidin/lichenicidin family type 2 lantibiotic
MSNLVHAWKDEMYRQSLSTQEQAMLPASPAGVGELTDAQLEAVFGGHDREEATNDIDQKVDQKAVATYDNKELEYSAVWCKVDNDAKLASKVKTFGDD